MLTNFAAGHSLSDFIFDVGGFENSVFTNFLLAPDGLAMPGHIFGSRFMAQHFSEANERTPCLVEVGISNGIFVPVLNDHLKDQGGLKAIADDLEKRDARNVAIGAQAVSRRLGVMSDTKVKWLPRSRNYGLQTEKLVTERVAELDPSAFDPEFAAFWEEIAQWRTEFIKTAIDWTYGEQAEGLKVARVVDVLTLSLTDLYAERKDIPTTHGPAELLKAIDDDEQRIRVSRFLKIICFLFNEAMAWAMDANHNWPVSDPDFLRFRPRIPDNPQRDETVDEREPDATLVEFDAPSIPVMKKCDEETLLRLRSLGRESGFFPAFRAWRESGTNKTQLAEALAAYMDSACNVVGRAESVRTACIAQASEKPAVQVASATLCGLVGAASGYLTGDVPTTLIGAGLGGAAGPMVGKGIDALIAFGTARSRIHRQAELGRALDITLLS